MVSEEPRLQITAVDPPTFACSVCGEKMEGGPSPTDVTAQFDMHLRKKHPLYYKGTQR